MIKFKNLGSFSQIAVVFISDILPGTTFMAKETPDASYRLYLRTPLHVIDLTEPTRVWDTQTRLRVYDYYPVNISIEIEPWTDPWINENAKSS